MNGNMNFFNFFLFSKIPGQPSAFPSAQNATLTQVERKDNNTHTQIAKQAFKDLEQRGSLSKCSYNFNCMAK